jgi:hypothetical protein
MESPKGADAVNFHSRKALLACLLLRHSEAPHVSLFFFLLQFTATEPPELILVWNLLERLLDVGWLHWHAHAGSLVHAGLLF